MLKQPVARPQSISISADYITLNGTKKHAQTDYWPTYSTHSLLIMIAPTAIGRGQ